MLLHPNRRSREKDEEYGQETLKGNLLTACFAKVGSFCIANARFVRGPNAKMVISPGCSVTVSMRKSAADPLCLSPCMHQHRC